MELNTFESKDELVNAVTDMIVDCVNESVEKYGNARILLSGGSTPGAVYEQLSNIDLEWDKVHIGLVDERFVASDDAFSNERLLKETLIQHAAKSAELTGMVYDLEDRETNRLLTEKNYRKFMERTDLTLLGMGGDGHTASLFPHDKMSEADLLNSTIGIVNTKAPAHPKKRISCSKALILNSRNIALMITGSSKLEILNDIDKKLPIHHLLEECEAIKTYYTE